MRCHDFLATEFRICQTAMYVSTEKHTADEKHQRESGRRTMPAPFYLGWAVMAVLALGTADMVRQVAGSMFRGQAGTSKAEAAKPRSLPRPKLVTQRNKPEWF